MVAPISVSFAYVLYKIVTVQTVQIFLMIYKKRTKKQTEKIAIFNNSLAQLFDTLFVLFLGSRFFSLAITSSII